jgi:hypothetical protein
MWDYFVLIIKIVWTAGWDGFIVPFVGGMPTKMSRGALDVSVFGTDSIHHVTLNYVGLVS